MAIRETTKVETGTRDDESQLVDTLVLAFDSDPIMRWFYPDPHDYLRYFPEFVRIYGGKAFDHGAAHYLPGGAGAALWLPPGVRPDEDAFVTLLQTSLPEEKQEQAWAVLEQVEQYHPTEPFWHLPVIGVDPTQQGHGHGSALMAHALRACDDEGAIAYLE